MSDLIERLRDEYNEVSLLDSRLEAADRIAELEAELAVWKTWGIVEIAARNPRVMEYVGHWEGRCLKAEAANAKMRKCLEEIEAHHKDCLMLDHGALNKLMQLYHTERRDFAREGLK